SMFSFGIRSALAFSTAFASAALPSGSPPPSRAATVIARASFVKSCPRRASAAPFLRLICAHLEWPATEVILGAAGAHQALGCRHPPQRNPILLGSGGSGLEGSPAGVSGRLYPPGA